MFGNRMNYTQSPGGQRRGLIYQSGGTNVKGAIGCLYDLEAILGGVNFVSDASEAFDYYIRFTKTGKTSFFIRVMSTDFTISYPNTLELDIEGWMPIALIEPIRLTVNGELIDFKDIDFELEHIKIQKETFVVTNDVDDSIYTKDMLVVYLNSNDFELVEETENYYTLRCRNVFTNWQVIEKTLPVKCYIYEGKNNNLITEVDGMYYPNIHDACRYWVDNWYNYDSINWGSLRKYTDSYTTKFKITYTGDWYYRPYDKYIPQYELNHLLQNERYYISNSPLTISKLFMHQGIYIRDDIYTFNAYKFNNLLSSTKIGGALFEVFYKNDPLKRSDRGFWFQSGYNDEIPTKTQPNNFIPSGFTPAINGYVFVKSFRCGSYTADIIDPLYDTERLSFLYPLLNLNTDLGVDTFGIWCLPDNATPSGYLQLQNIDEKIVYEDHIYST